MNQPESMDVIARAKENRGCPVALKDNYRPERSSETMLEEVARGIAAAVRIPVGSDDETQSLLLLSAGIGISVAIAAQFDWFWRLFF